MEQLIPSTTTTELVFWQLLKLVCLEPVLQDKRSHCNEKPTHSNEISPSSLQLEKAHAEQQRSSTAKKREMENSK